MLFRSARLRSSVQQAYVCLALLETIRSEASDPDAGDGQGAGDKKAKFPWASRHAVTGRRLHIAKTKDRNPTVVLREEHRQILCCVIARLGALIYIYIYI